MSDEWHFHQNYQIEFRYFFQICFTNILTNIDKDEFPNDLKHADIVLVYKKNNKCEKEN